MLSARRLAYTVPSGRRLLDDVSVSFVPGAISLIVGPNGAGKSTLLRALCREVRPQAGEVCYGDCPLDQWTEPELARVRGVLSQAVELGFPLRVWEVVLMGRYPHFTGRPTSRDEAACEAAMKRVDVWDWAERDYLTLSGGERQRVQFARVLAQVWEPPPSGGSRYLLLDEPLTYLDIRHQLEFLAQIRALSAGGDLVVVGVVHDLNLAARFGDHVVVMHEGRVLADGTPASVLTPEHIETAFGVRPVVHQVGGRGHLVFG
jgi:iron complex transport system ATP-binding protein